MVAVSDWHVYTPDTETLPSQKMYALLGKDHWVVY